MTDLEMLLTVIELSGAQVNISTKHQIQEMRRTWILMPELQGMHLSPDICEGESDLTRHFLLGEESNLEIKDENILGEFIKRLLTIQ
jgi:hypothetical protein